MNKSHDSIETALRVPEPMLTDDEFSANVLARLPSPRRAAMLAAGPSRAVLPSAARSR